MLHEHTTCYRIDSLLVHLFDVLDVGAQRDLVSGVDPTSEGNQTKMAHFLHSLGHLAVGR